MTRYKHKTHYVDEFAEARDKLDAAQANIAELERRFSQADSRKERMMIGPQLASAREIAATLKGYLRECEQEKVR